MSARTQTSEMLGQFINGRFIRRMAGGEQPPPGDDDPKSGDDSKDDGDDFDRDRALATIRRLRDQEKTLKAQVKDADALRKRVQEIEDKDKSEVERQASRAQEAQAKLTAAEQRAADLMLQMSVERAARKLGFIDEDDAFRLLDRKAVTLDDDGEPTNVDALLKDLAKAKPHLIAADDAGQKTGNGTRAVPGTPKPSGQKSSRAELVEQARKELAAGGRYTPL